MPRCLVLLYLPEIWGASWELPPLALLVTEFGWRASFFVIGAITFLIAIICWLLVRDNPGTGSPLLVNKDKEPLPARKQGKNIGTKLRQSFLKELAGLQEVIKNSNTWALLFSAFAVGGTVLAFAGTWSITYLMQVYGFSRNQASLYMMTLSVGKLAGFPLTGIIADKIGRKKPLFFLFAFYITSWSVLLFWHGGKAPADALYIIFFLMGFSSGLQVLMPTLAKETNDLQFSGLAISVVNIGAFAGMAFLQPFMGYILDLKWDGVLAAGAKIYPLESFQLLFVSSLIINCICFAFACLHLKIKK